MGHQPRNTDRRHHPNPPAAPQQRTNNSLNFKQLLCKAETHQQLCGRAKTQLTQHYDDMHLMARQQPLGSDSADAFGACDNFLVRHRTTKNQVPKCRRRRYLPQPYRQAKAAQMPANSPTSSTLPLTNSRRHVLQHFRNKATALRTGGPPPVLNSEMGIFGTRMYVVVLRNGRLGPR